MVILVPGGGGSGALQRTMCLGLQGRVGGRVGVSGLLWGCEIGHDVEERVDLPAAIVNMNGLSRVCSTLAYVDTSRGGE